MNALTFEQMLDLAPDIFVTLRTEMFRRSGRLGDRPMHSADQLFAALCIIAERHAGLDLTGVPRCRRADGLVVGAASNTTRTHVVWLCEDISERVSALNREAVDLLWIAFKYCIGNSKQVCRIVADVVETQQAGSRYVVVPQGDDADWADAQPARKRKTA